MFWNIRKQKQPIRTIKRKKNPKNEDNISSLWDNFKRSSIRIIGVPEGEEKEQEIGNLLEKIMIENFPNLLKERAIEVQEAQRVPIMMDGKRTTPRHVTIKMPKIKYKKRILKAVREKTLPKGSSHKTVSWFLKRNFVG